MVSANDFLKTADESHGREFQNIIAQGQSFYARTTIRMGDIARGMKLLQTLQDKQIFNECAVILEGLKQYSEAALIYEKAKNYEKAAELYIKSRPILKVNVSVNL
jgi:WD repeat-containing protein 19